MRTEWDVFTVCTHTCFDSHSLSVSSVHPCPSFLPAMPHSNTRTLTSLLSRTHALTLTLTHFNTHNFTPHTLSLSRNEFCQRHQQANWWKHNRTRLHNQIEVQERERRQQSMHGETKERGGERCLLCPYTRYCVLTLSSALMVLFIYFDIFNLTIPPDTTFTSSDIMTYTPSPLLF